MKSEADDVVRRVLMVVSAFPPSVEMGAQACWQIARNLPRHGWTPIVLTMEEGHAEYSGSQAGFEPGFPVVRTGALPHPVSLLRRIRAAQKAGGGEAAEVVASGDSDGRRGWLRQTVLAWLNVPDTLTGWIPPAVLAGRRLLRGSDVACLFSSGPAWSSHLAALALARLTGLPWVAHFRDPWSQGQGSRDQGEPRWADRMNARLERAVVRRAARVICVTEQHANVLRRHYVSCAPEKFVTISNGYDGAEWEQLERERSAAGARARTEQFVITYAGALYVGRSPLLVLQALTRLAQVGDIPADRVRLDLILYDGVRHLPDGREMMEVAREMGLGGSLRIEGPFRRDETLRRLLDSDLLLLLGNNLTMQIPGKLYEYLRTGRPILALVPAGPQTDLLRATGGAWIVEPDDVDAAVAAIRDAYQRWLSGRPGPMADARLVSSFDRRVLVGRFAREMDAAVSQTGRPRRGRQRPIPGRK